MRGNPVVRCTGCGKQPRHFREKWRTEPYICTSCADQKRTVASQGGPHRCKTCRKEFPNWHAAYWHVRKVHTPYRGPGLYIEAAPKSRG